MKTKHLLLIVLVLAGIYAVIHFTDTNRNESTIPIENLEIDTATIQSIRFNPELMNKAELLIQREASGWTITHADKSYPADKSSVDILLRELGKLRISRMVGKNAESWAKYELTDEQIIPVQIQMEDNKTLRMNIGGFDFDQQTNQPLTYVRFNEDEKSYLVNGYLLGLFNRDLASYRNKTISKCDAEQITKVSFTYPGDSSFVLSKNNGYWFRNMQAIDSTACKTYINSLGNLTSPAIIEEDIDIQKLNPYYTLRIEGDSLETIEVKAYSGHPLYPLIVTSSMNDESIFKGDFSNIFVSPGKFDIP